MRHTASKIEVLDARYPGLRQRIEAMFEELCPPRDIKRMIETQYGERIGWRSIIRYQNEYWRQRRQTRDARSGSAEMSGCRLAPLPLPSDLVPAGARPPYRPEYRENRPFNSAIQQHARSDGSYRWCWTPEAPIESAAGRHRSAQPEHRGELNPPRQMECKAT